MSASVVDAGEQQRTPSFCPWWSHQQAWFGADAPLGAIAAAAWIGDAFWYQNLQNQLLSFSSDPYPLLLYLFV